MRGQLYCRRFVLQRRILIEKLIDPNRQRKGGSIKRMLFKCVRRTYWLVSIKTIVLGLVAGKESIDFRAPILGVQQMRPAHFAGYNLITPRIVEIRFQ